MAKYHGGERCGNAGTKIPAGMVEGGERKQTADEVSKRMLSKPGVDPTSGTSSGDVMILPSGIRYVGGANLNPVLVWNVRTCASMLRERLHAVPTAGVKVPKRSAGAEEPVVVMKVP